MTTTINEAREAIYQAFVTGWGARTAYQLEGVPFDEPGIDIEWVRVVVRNFTGTTETMGDVDQKKHRRNAAVIISIFTPADQGMKSGAEHAQFALGLFESKNIAVPSSAETLDCIAGDVREIPLGDDEKSRMTEVEVPFAFTQTK
tara:strand:- start:269 stop:703 length:435 start_codon:yes stop_codon:yes gene_type:complete